MPNHNIFTFRPSLLKQLLLSHIIGLPLAYLLTSYFSNLYPGIFQFISLSLLFQIVCGMVVFLFLKEKPKDLVEYLQKHWTSILTLFVILILAVFTVVMSLQFPSLFDKNVISTDKALLPWFIGLIVISTFGVVVLVKVLEEKGFIGSFRASQFFQLIQENRAGILLALLFFFTYFVLTQSLNFPGHRTLDQYFDTDISDWIRRLTSNPRDEMPMIRAVHPAVMIILRPLTWILSILLNGNKLQAVFLLSALAGAFCVFLVWLIVKRNTSNTAYALVFASILGAGTAHLLLSSMMETYIFSAFALILFCFLIQSERTSLKFTVPVGVLIFGITISNLAQAGILYFLKRPSIKLMIKFVLAILAITLLLNILQVNIFPSADPVYETSSMNVEENYRYNLFAGRWQSIGRINLISRAILLYGVVAPKPFVLMEELGINVPNFRTFEIAILTFKVAGYKGFADIVAKIWIGILGLAFIQLAVQFFKSPKQTLFPISLLLCMGFSFVLHLFYGDDPMLYSPNWTYALVLFTAVSLGKWANNRWLQLGLIIFLGMIVYTNLGLIHQILEVSLPYYGK